MPGHCYILFFAVNFQRKIRSCGNFKPHYQIVEYIDISDVLNWVISKRSHPSILIAFSSRSVPATRRTLPQFKQESSRNSLLDIFLFNPILDGRLFLSLQTNFPKYSENGQRPALYYLWLKISPRHTVKISAWYKYENFFYDFSQKDGWQ